MNNKNKQNQIKDLLSYATFLNDRKNFRKSGTRSGSEFNYFDSPRQTYFKILFYFCNGDSDGLTGNDTGLLAPTWALYDGLQNNTPYYTYNSAWAYLKMNGEDARAEKLKQFVTLLSNINSEAPWTFTSVSGLDQALERQSAGQNKEFKIDEERKKISIKCLPDTFDERIGTLLDLYRDIVWSWKTKREMIPANLRKFDMALYLFSDPIKNIHTPKENAEASLSSNANYLTSSKYVEFHNCEIDYNSSKSPFSELNNAEGNQLEYTIDIYYDDAYEYRWNEFMEQQIGDIIIQNTIDTVNHKTELKDRIEMYNRNDGFISNAVDELIGAGKSILDNKVKSIVLGNMFTLSPTQLWQQIKGAAKGNILSTADVLDDYTEHLNKGSNKKTINGKLFENSNNHINIKPGLGNMFKGKSVAKNI